MIKKFYHSSHLFLLKFEQYYLLVGRQVEFSKKEFVDIFDTSGYELVILNKTFCHKNVEQIKILPFPWDAPAL